MLEHRRTTKLAVASLLWAVCGPIHAESSGKADLDSVVPAGPVDPSSGAPAAWHKPIKDKQINRFFLLDRLEYGATNGPDDYAWDAQGWIGGDYNKLWLKTEGEGAFERSAPETTELQALYSRMISSFWGAQAGVRYDINPNPNPDRGFAVLGLQGLAAYWFESETALFVSQDGDVSFRGAFEYELLFTQKLILQPRLEINAAVQDAPRYGIASGLNNTSVGLRLRYEIRREFAPYIGVRWEQQYGDTKDLARADNQASSSIAFVLGLRAWY